MRSTEIRGYNNEEKVCCGVGILLYMVDEKIIEQAAQWMRENTDRVLRSVVLDREPRTARKCIFMAGSPGAGKTETVHRLRLRERFVVLEAEEQSEGDFALRVGVN